MEGSKLMLHSGTPDEYTDVQFTKVRFCFGKIRKNINRLSFWPIYGIKVVVFFLNNLKAVLFKPY